MSLDPVLILALLNDAAVDEDDIDGTLRELSSPPAPVRSMIVLSTDAKPKIIVEQHALKTVFEIFSALNLTHSFNFFFFSRVFNIFLFFVSPCLRFLDFSFS